MGCQGVIVLNFVTFKNIVKGIQTPSGLFVDYCVFEGVFYINIIIFLLLGDIGADFGS